MIPDTVQVIEQIPETVELSQIHAETGEVTKVKKTRKQEVIDISTNHKDNEVPITTVTVLDEKPAEKDRPQEITEIPEETIVEQGDCKIKKITKRIVKKTVEEPEMEITEEVLDQTVDDFLYDVIPDTAQVIEETPETVEMSQVHAETGKVTKVKKTKKVIHKEMDGKQEVIEISTIQKDDEAPVTTLTILEEKPEEKDRPPEITEIPEETVVEQIQTPEADRKIKENTKRVVKKTVETPKIETMEDILDQSVDFLHDVLPDAAVVIEDTKTSEVSQIGQEIDITKFKKPTKEKPTVKHEKEYEIAPVQEQINENTDIPVKQKRKDGKSTVANMKNSINVVKLTLNHHTHR